MAIKETVFTLDLTREGRHPVVKFRLNDNKVQKITFRLTNNGREIDLEREMGDQFKPVFECIFRDKTFKRDEDRGNWEIKRDTTGKFPLYTFTYYLTDEVINKSGIACYYFALETPEGLRISTPTLKMVIDCDFKEDGKPSENYVSEFEKLLKEAERVKQTIKDLDETLKEVLDGGASITEVIRARENAEGIYFKDLKDRLDDNDKNYKKLSKEINESRKDVNGNHHESLNQRLNYDYEEVMKQIGYIKFDVRRFGAKLNGEDDDTQPIQKTINHVSSLGGGVVLIPYTKNGCKIIQGEIVIPSNIRIIGQNTKLFITPSETNKSIFKSDMRSYDENIAIKNFNFISSNEKERANGRGQSGSNISAIQLSNVKNITIEDVYFENCEFGIKVDVNGRGIHFKNLSASGTYQPLYFSNCKYIKGKDVIFDRTGMKNSLDHHVYINNGTSHLSIIDLIFIGGNGYAIDAKDDSAVSPSTNLYFENITGENIGGFIVAERKSEVVASNFKLKIDKGNASKNIFGILNDGKIRASNFEVTGGGTLFAALDSPNGEITVDNGVVDRLSTRLIISNSLKHIKASHIKFSDIISDDGVGIFNMDGYSVSLLEFYNCHFVFKSTPSNDPMSHRKNVTRYYDCIFDANVDIATFSYTHPQGESMFKNCLSRGSFARFEWSGSTGKVSIYDCIDERDNSIFNSKYAIKKLYGIGSPEGVYTAPIGSEFFRVDGGTGTARYLKEIGSGNTGWIAK